MAIRKVSKEVTKIETSEISAVAREIPVAKPAAVKPPSTRAAKVVKLVSSPEVKPAPVAVKTPPKTSPKTSPKTPPKPRATRAAKQVTESAAAPEQAQAAEPAKPSKPAKIKRAKLVRDSFTMPEAEHALIAGLKKRCLNLGVAAKKSEVLRAALAVLARLSDAEAAAAIQALAPIKTGRPAKGAK